MKQDWSIFTGLLCRTWLADMILPSKQLLSEVLGKEVIKIAFAKTGDRGQSLSNNNIEISIYPYHTVYFNIYELMHMMKEWAVVRNQECKNIDGKEQFYINDICSQFIGFSHIWQCIVGYRNITEEYNSDEKKCFTSETETEAVFQACEWILNEITN